jgi:hypothetical protein
MMLDVSTLYASTGTAKLADLSAYEARVKELVSLYLRLAHTLHGRARVLIYDSPVTGQVEIFNHNPH